MNESSSARVASRAGPIVRMAWGSALLDHVELLQQPAFLGEIALERLRIVLAAGEIVGRLMKIPHQRGERLRFRRRAACRGELLLHVRGQAGGRRKATDAEGGDIIALLTQRRR